MRLTKRHGGSASTVAKRRPARLPSALRRALPQFGNEVVFMLHGSVVASVITLQDILGAGRTLNAKFYLAYEGLLTAAALYMAAVPSWSYLGHLAPR